MRGIGEVLLLCALFIFSSSNTAFSLLQQHDEELFLPCNVLCSSNIIGLVLLSLFNVRKISLADLRGVSGRQWAWLSIGSCLYSVLGPFLYMTGLSLTDVPTAAIIQRLESINLVILSFMFLKKPLSRWTVCNAALTLLGILLALLSPLFWGNAISIPIGVIFIVIAGFSYSSSLLISLKFLKPVPVPIVAVFRVAVGTALYHVIVLIMSKDPGRLYAPEL